MTDSDPIILEILNEADVYLSPKGIVLNLEASGKDLHRATVQRSLKRLENGDMVKRYNEDSSWRRITDYGKQYLNDAGEMTIEAFLEEYEEL